MLSIRAVLAAARPTARASHLGPAGLTVLLGAVPTAVELARGAPSVSAPAIVAGLAAGAALGWAGEDPTAEVLTPMPISTPVRTWMRALSITATAATISAVLAIAVAIGPGLPADLGQRAAEAAAAATAALALGVALNRGGERGAGASGVTGGLLVPLFVVALAHRWPRLLPSFSAGPVHHRWWVVVMLLAVVLARVGRDPARA